VYRQGNRAEELGCLNGYYIHACRRFLQHIVRLVGSGEGAVQGCMDREQMKHNAVHLDYWGMAWEGMLLSSSRGRHASRK
jgi:hypothetical protein